MDGAASLVGIVLFLWLIVYVCVLLPMSMAAARGRSRLGWLLLTLLFSPFISIIALMVLGPTAELVIAEMNEDGSN
ncbi:hypothetical protein [Pacificibacter marinus]|uniref:Cardiolipin synthase N-terminal domain-containing protein n=1 Tax=Pacificibacter marinus TaxID=658057 RepID=A0A1Y5TNS7_9RHOB|nr:hypothetical protein [Pacificibacter marinus]SEL29733.1 hypothetical protein SAMN04488032_11689 [Pacificibacter marinus]SLN66258.1 hypothetical protein PAM7971_03480 [Pacificibacter marinus]